MTPIRRFIREMPKAELHLHIEGTLEPEMLMALAARNGVRLRFRSVDEVRAAYRFGSLQDFLDIYYQGMSVLVREQDFFDLTWAYLARMHAERTTHVEIFFDPQGHTARGVAFDTVLNGIVRALEQGERELGITSRLIMCFLRHLTEDDAFATLAAARPALGHLHGVGLDSSEAGHPPAKFARVYRAARQVGLAPVAHAGEEGPPDYVREALDVLEVRRIDHGNRALEDERLVARLAANRVPLTVCPLSNLRLQVVRDLAAHPLRRMLEAGLLATVNSDDPAYFGGYLTDNLLAVQAALGLDRAEVETLGRNAFLAAFLGEREKNAAVERFDRFAGGFR